MNVALRHHPQPPARTPRRKLYVIACPFCGTNPIIRTEGNKTTIACEAPACKAHVSVAASTEAAAVERWNRRR